MRPTHFPRMLRNPVFVVALTLMGCKKKCKPDQDKDTGTDTVDVADINNTMKVGSINPSRVPEGLPFQATITGSGFSSGATVTIGITDADRVTLLNSTQLAIEMQGLPIGRYDVEVSNVQGETVILRGGLSVEAAVNNLNCEGATVFFPTDSSTITPEAKSTIDGRVGCYAKATATIQVDGHADERGTTEYNLALGERRASAAKAYLSSAGVPADRIQTASFGEERPADDGHDEGAWQKNRRAEIYPKR